MDKEYMFRLTVVSVVCIGAVFICVSLLDSIAGHKAPAGRTVRPVADTVMHADSVPSIETVFSVASAGEAAPVAAGRNPGASGPAPRQEKGKSVASYSLESAPPARPVLVGDIGSGEKMWVRWANAVRGWVDTWSGRKDKQQTPAVPHVTPEEWDAVVTPDVVRTVKASGVAAGTGLPDSKRTNVIADASAGTVASAGRKQNGQTLSGNERISVSEMFEDREGYEKHSVKYDYKTVSLSGMDMVRVEGGSFHMGMTEEQAPYAEQDELPCTYVTVGSFLMGRYEVTQKQWVELMGDNPSRVQGDNLPVDGVSYVAALEYVRRLSERTGKTFRLPTEEEWEYAARGGNSSRSCIFSGSDMIQEVAWTKKNSSGGVHPVGMLAPNELGIYDMSGNVREWCSSGYASYQNTNTGKNGHVGQSTALKVMRGGNVTSSDRSCRVSSRYVSPPGATNVFSGLRVVCEID